MPIVRRPARRASAILPVAVTFFAATAPAQTPAPCTPAPSTATAAEWLAQAARASGYGIFGDRPLHLKIVDETSQAYQSDRTYPPYLFYPASGDTWYVPSTGVERRHTSYLTPFGKSPDVTILFDDRAVYGMRSDMGIDSLVPAPGARGLADRSRALNPWAVLRDWQDGPAPTVVGLCPYRDYRRLVLEREGPEGPERIFLSTTAHLPVKLERAESDRIGLWGVQPVEYLYTNWFALDGASYPMASYRIVDGQTDIIRTATADSITDSLPRLTLPEGAADMRASSAATAAASEPDTVRVGPQTVLLHTRFYTNTVALVRDTLFILDAQYPGESRARADSTWIGRLFPGRHPIVLVVSDLAWPHIAGVRYWVANGARVVSHRASRDFLTRVVERRWRDRSDLLERVRDRVTFRFQAVDDSLVLAGGDVRVYAIDGIGSEGAVMTYLPRDRFLFAGDFIQTVQAPSAYAREVRAATERVGIIPDRVAAMHLPLTPWRAIEELLGP